MKMPIRIKLLLYMTVSILIFTIVLLSANMIFTKKTYINYKKRILIESSEKIQNLIREDSDFDYFLMEFELSRLERSIGGSIFIGTLDGKIFYPLDMDFGGLARKNPFFMDEPKPIQNKIKSYERYTDNSFFMITEDPNLDFETLRFQTSYDNGLEVLIWLPMPEISESINVFNNIIAVTAISVLIGSVLWSLFVSGKFTKPIRQMNKVAKKISMQDFSETIKITGNDEIAELADSINEISLKLSNSISRLNEKNEQLENEIINEKNLDKMRKEFVAGVSHELKTPIFLIQGYAEGLKKVAHKEDKRNFYCDVIMNETEKMDKLLKDLLDLAQIESGMFIIQSQVFDIVELTENSLHKFQPVFDSKKINFTSNFPDYLEVYADPIRVEQIIVNFINNAIDYIDSKREIKITITSFLDKAKISVFNSGVNIPNDVIDKLWTSFYKADESRAREYGGTGLGLSIVKAIQDGHKNLYGVINVANGVEFWITLNLAK